MSDTDNLERRLHALAAVPDGGADWEDVLRRAGEGHAAPRFAPRQLVLALALVAAAVLAASLVGVFSGHATRPSSSTHPTRPGLQGPTGAVGPTGRGLEIPPQIPPPPDGSNPYGQNGRQITIAALRAEAPYIPLPNSDLANDKNVGSVWVWDHTSDPAHPKADVDAAIFYPGSGIELYWLSDGLHYTEFPPLELKTIDGISAIVFNYMAGGAGVRGVPALSALNLPVGTRVLYLDGAVRPRELMAVAQTLSPSPGDASPAGGLPPAKLQPGPYLTRWDGFLSDAVSVGSVDDAAGSLAFQPVVPQSLGDPSAILETDPTSEAPSDRVLSLRYDDSSMGRFWLLERPSLSTSTSLLNEIASSCPHKHECLDQASMVDLGAGLSGLQLADDLIERIVWVHDGVYFEVVGYAGASYVRTLSPADALSVAKAVAAG